MLGNLTFCAEQRGGALQESPDLLQRSLFSASDAALGIMAAGQGGDLIEDDRKLWLVCQHRHGVEDKLDIRRFNITATIRHVHVLWVIAVKLKADNRLRFNLDDGTCEIQIS